MRFANLVVSGSIILVLVACGGGGGSAEAPTIPPTPLPETVSITAPPRVQVTDAVAFRPSFSGSSGLSFRWDFGDGSSSAESSPTHIFSQPGDYQVALKVVDASGAARSATLDVVVNSQAHVRGLVCSAPDEAGWCWSRSMQGNGDLFNDVFFISPDIGWAASDSGAVYKTLDAGKTWKRQLSVPRTPLRKVEFVTPDKGWVLTKSGVLYGSSDGGETWRAQLDASADFYGNYYGETPLLVGDAMRLVVSNLGASHLSADGGQTWTSVPTEILAIRDDTALWGASSRSANFGQSFEDYTPVSLVSGYEVMAGLSVIDGLTAVRQVNTRSPYPYAKALLLTSDGGRTWLRREIGPDGPSMGVSVSPMVMDAPVILAASADKLWATAGGGVARSADAGKTWSWPGADGVRPKGRMTLAMTYPGKPDSFSVVLHEYPTPYGRAEAVYSTDDAGVNWKRYAVNDAFGQQEIESYKRLGPRSLMVRNSMKTVFRTDDDGANWSVLAGMPQLLPAIRKIVVLKDMQGLALTRYDTIMATTDGGQNWSDRGSATALHVFETIVWGLVGHTLRSSTDMGRTWSENKGPVLADVSAGLLAMHFFDSTHGLVAAADHRTYRTDDGGQTWTMLGQLDTDFALSMTFANEKDGLVFSLRQLKVTQDGGVSWQNSTLPVLTMNFNDIKLVDGLNGWAVGESPNLVSGGYKGMLYETRDGGLTWVQRTLPEGTAPLNAISFANASLGWIVGNAGTILLTRDGGKTWLRQDITSTRDLTAVYFNSSKTGWIGGANGEFMATGTGGF